MSVFFFHFKENASLFGFSLGCRLVFHIFQVSIELQSLRFVQLIVSFFFFFSRSIGVDDGEARELSLRPAPYIG